MAEISRITIKDMKKFEKFEKKKEKNTHCEEIGNLRGAPWTGPSRQTFRTIHQRFDRYLMPTAERAKSSAGVQRTSDTLSKIHTFPVRSDGQVFIWGWKKDSNRSTDLLPTRSIRGDRTSDPEN